METVSYFLLPFRIMMYPNKGYNYKSSHILISVTYKWTVRFRTPKLENHINTALLC